MQLGSGDGDVVLCRTAVVLIGLGLLAGRALLVISAAATRANVRAALRGVDAAVGGQLAVNVYLYINEIFFSAVVCSAGGVDHGNELAVAIATAAVFAPLIHIVDVHALTSRHDQLRVPADRHLHARQQRHRLVQRQLAAAAQVHRHVVGQRQNIGAGVNRYASQFQIQFVELRLAVDRVVDAVGTAVIRFGQAAGGQLEHTVICDERNGGRLDASQGVHSAIRDFGCPRVYGQRHLDILHRVLVEGEHLVFDLGGGGAAAEVENLIPLVHRAAGLYGDSTAAGDKAPCIEIAAVLDRDGAVVSHFDVSIITNGTSLPAAGSGKISAAQADGAIDGNGRAFAHRQCPECLRRRSRPNCRRSIRIQRSRLIKRDQQCDAGWDRIVPCDFAVGSQRDFVLVVCPRIDNRFVQVVKRLAAGFKQGRRFTCELRCDGAVTFDIQGGGCRSRDAFACGQVIPAQELITLRRGRHYLIRGRGALHVAVFLGNEFSVYFISTVFSRHKGSSRRYIRDQRYIGHGNFCSCRAARLDINIDATTRGKLPFEAAVCGNGISSDINRAAVLLDGISKGQCSLCSLVVFDGQCGIIGCIAACSTNRYD